LVFSYLLQEIKYGEGKRDHGAIESIFSVHMGSVASSIAMMAMFLYCFLRVCLYLLPSSKRRVPLPVEPMALAEIHHQSSP